MILGENLASYLGFPLAQAERRLAEGDGGTVRPARRLGRDVVMGAPTEPTAVAVPVTNPTRESEVRERDREGLVGKDGACRSHQDKLEKSNFKTMSCPSKLAEAVNHKIRGGWIYLR